jgi:hypothetical protein
MNRQGDCFLKLIRQQRPCLDAVQNVVLREDQFDGELVVKETRAWKHDFTKTGLAGAWEVSRDYLLEFAVINTIGSKRSPEAPGHADQFSPPSVDAL